MPKLRDCPNGLLKMLDKMKNNWAALSFIAVLLSAGAVAGQEVFQIRQQVAENTSQLAMARFNRLSDQRERYGLNAHQHAEWCKLGIHLQIFRVCPAWKKSG